VALFSCILFRLVYGWHLLIIDWLHLIKPELALWKFKHHNIVKYTLLSNMLLDYRTRTLNWTYLSVCILYRMVYWYVWELDLCTSWLKQNSLRNCNLPENWDKSSKIKHILQTKVKPIVFVFEINNRTEGIQKLFLFLFRLKLKKNLIDYSW